MTQWDFLLSWEDVWLVLDLIVSRPGTELVHDLWYKTRTFNCYSVLNKEARDAIKARPSLYVRADDFSNLPVDMHAVGEGTPEVLYLVQCNFGGPLIQLSVRGEYRSKGQTVIPPSMLSYSGEYMNTISGEWEKPSSELKAAFKDIQRIVKQVMQRCKGQGGFAWVGQNAIRLLKDRRATTN